MAARAGAATNRRVSNTVRTRPIRSRVSTSRLSTAGSAAKRRTRTSKIGSGTESTAISCATTPIRFSLRLARSSAHRASRRRPEQGKYRQGLRLRDFRILRPGRADVPHRRSAGNTARSRRIVLSVEISSAAAGLRRSPRVHLRQQPLSSVRADAGGWPNVSGTARIRHVRMSVRVSAPAPRRPGQQPACLASHCRRLTRRGSARRCSNRSAA